MKKQTKILVFGIIIACFCLVWFFLGMEGSQNMDNDSVDENNLNKLLNSNYILFSEVAAYLENDPGEFYCYKTSEGLRVRSDALDINIEDYEIGEKVLYIIYELGFCGILENDDYIQFIEQGGIIEQGLFYTKSGKTIEEFDQMPIGKITMIKDQWLFFYFRHSD